ncbi:3848_t:CDS:2 [Racocetra fulgida]|uniref:3848_t:CDS:1 n=1 Tax=Racocetra fulgida TaxID=60492 RepID=A0A9N8WGH7_9GLOM|nr:3848_t:CDS:2 [Racocetra fulgida]
MDQLKISQTVPTFAVYPDEMKKQFTQYNYLSTSQHIHSSDPLPTAQASSSSTTLPAVEYILSDDDLVIPSSQSTKGKNKRPLTEDDDTDNRLWADSAIKALLAYLSENFSHYRKNKEKFYASAALHIGGNDDDLSYIKSVEAISESKKLSAENRKKWIEEHSTIERDRFELEKKYRELEYQLKKQEVEARIKVENERLDLDKQMKINFELKLKELETKLNELEMKHK